MKLTFATENSVDGVSGQLSTTADPQDQGGAQTTYDDGDGVKDLIVMTGPLGNAYTKALDVYFAKRPIGTPPDDGGKVEKYPGDLTEEATGETVAMDTTMSSALMDVAASNVNFPEGAAPRLQLLSPYDDFDVQPDATVFVIDNDQIRQPQNVQVIQAANKICKDNGRPFAIMVTEVRANGTITQNRQPELEFNNDKSVINIDHKFEADTDPLADPEAEANQFALERLFDGIEVLRGVQGFHGWVQKRYTK